METMTMMNPTFLTMTHLNVAEPVKREMTEDDMVPTTVDAESDPGYNSDNGGGFYSNDEKDNNSGTSTPLTVDGNMENWHEQYAANLMLSAASPTQTQKYPSVYTGASEGTTAHQDQVVFDLDKTTPTFLTEANNDFNFNWNNNNDGDNNNTDAMKMMSGYEPAVSSSSGHSTDDHYSDGEDKSDILRRSVKGMTAEEKKLRRRELNRLAAQRSRQKKKTTSSTLAEESQRLARRNDELRKQLGSLEKVKTELYDMIKNHFKKCTPKNQPAIIIPKPEYPINHHHHQHVPAVVAPRAMVAGYGVGGYQGYNVAATVGQQQHSGGD